MNSEFKTALESLSVPDNISEEVINGVDRAWRYKIMKKKVFGACGIAAVFVICAVIAFIGIQNKPLIIPDDALIRVSSIDCMTGKPVLIAVSAEGKELGELEYESVTYLDENNQSIDPDEIFYFTAYWIDENGEIAFSEISAGGVSVQVDTKYGNKCYKLMDFNTNDWNNQLTFSMFNEKYAFTDKNDVYSDENAKVTMYFSEDDGKMSLKTEIDSKDEPFNRIVKTVPVRYQVFSSVPEMLGGMGGTRIEGELNVSGAIELYDGKKLITEGCEMYVNLSDDETAQKYWIRVAELAAQLDDGSIIYISGDWLAEFEA